MRGGAAAHLSNAEINVADYFLFGLVAPGAIALAPPVRGVGSSLIWLPGARLDAPWVGAGVVFCIMWPGLEVETPRLAQHLCLRLWLAAPRSVAPGGLPGRVPFFSEHWQ